MAAYEELLEIIKTQQTIIRLPRKLKPRRNNLTKR